MPRLSPHLRAVLQALLVTFIWSTSFVLIKIGLEEVPALTFAGLRYTAAALILLPFALLPAGNRAAVCRLTRRDWGRLVALGVVLYTIAQGAQYVALDGLPSATVSMFFNFSVIVVAVLGIFTLRERLTAFQWWGLIISLAGAYIYLYPIIFPEGQIIGVLAALTGMLAGASASVMGRQINRDGAFPPVVVTAISMSVGAVLMLAAGLLTEGRPAPSLTTWLVIFGLALVNTAFAFTLWNRTLRILPAAESAIINNTMLIQVAALAWIFLGEALDFKAVLGLALAVTGTLMVQRRAGRQRIPRTVPQEV